MNRPRTTKRRAAANTLPAKMLELQMAAPLVIAHRLTRMATTGPQLSSRDRKEFSGMFMEKPAAFYLSWFSMGVEIQRLQWEFAQRFFNAAVLHPASFNPYKLMPSLSQWQQAGNRIALQGLRPVHRKAVSNANRLSRSRS